MPSKPPVHRPAGYLASKQATQRQYDQRRGSDRQFYSTPTWRRFRKARLLESPLCHDCEEQRAELVQAEEIHHIIARHARPDLAYEPTNMMSLCKSCHSRRTRQESHR